MRILFIGDIVGGAGKKIALQQLPNLLEKHKVDFTIANGENCTSGFGMNKSSFDQLIACGIDAFTMGNHTWDNKDIFRFINDEPRIVRPANIPDIMPGRGYGFFDVNGEKLAIINLLGQVYMTPLNNPFATVDQILPEILKQTHNVFLDFHAEVTSEKVAMGWYLDGRVSAIVGTHTHIQTNDARILPRGSAYLTDAGMTGPRDSVLGVDTDIIIQRFRSGHSERFQVAEGDLQFNGVLIDIDTDGKATNIETINFWQPSLYNDM